MARPKTMWFIAGALAFLACTAAASMGADQESLDAAARAAELVQQRFGSESGFRANVQGPLANGGDAATAMKTLDGSQSFSPMISAQTPVAFLTLQAAVGPFADLTGVVLSQDNDMDGAVDRTWSPPLPVSGVCANGFITCTEGTWSGCSHWRWVVQSDGGIDVELAATTQALTGCYCSNGFCGRYMARSNLNKVLSDLGGGAMRALQSAQPQILLAGVNSASGRIEYFGQNLQRSVDDGKGGEVDPAQLAAVEAFGRAVQSEETGIRAQELAAGTLQLEGRGEQALGDQASDQESAYTALQAQSKAERRACTQRRNVKPLEEKADCPAVYGAGSHVFPTDRTHKAVSFTGSGGNELVFLDALGGRTVGLSFSGLSLLNRLYVFNSALRMTDLRVEYDGAANSSEIIGEVIVPEETVCTVNSQTGQETCVLRPSSVTRVAQVSALGLRVRLVDAAGADTSRIAGFDGAGGPGYVNAYAASGNELVLGRADGSIFGRLVFGDGPKCPLDNALTCSGVPAQCARSLGMSESISNGCLALEQDADCTLQAEIVDGTETLRWGEATGEATTSTCRTFPVFAGEVEACREWWSKERAYACLIREKADFSTYSERADAVYGSLSGDGSYRDRRRLEDGTWAEEDRQIQMPGGAKGAPCEMACKTRTVVLRTQVNDDGPLTRRVKSADSYEYHYRSCSTSMVCPTELPGESVVKGCSCMDEFSEAVTAMGVLHDAGKDMICSESPQP